MPGRRPELADGQLDNVARREAYRVLRSNLSVALSEFERPSVIVTSAYAGEGKTSTIANLAYSMAMAGQRVVLVDLDLRHPDVHHWFGAPNDMGVTEVLRWRLARNLIRARG